MGQSVSRPNGMNFSEMRKFTLFWLLLAIPLLMYNIIAKATLTVRMHICTYSICGVRDAYNLSDGNSPKDNNSNNVEGNSITATGTHTTMARQLQKKPLRITQSSQRPWKVTLEIIRQPWKLLFRTEKRIWEYWILKRVVARCFVWWQRRMINIWIHTLYRRMIQWCNCTWV